MGKHRKSSSKRHRDSHQRDDVDENANAYSLLPDTQSPFSCCCICYRYLLDLCLVLAMTPFIINCFLEAVIYLIKFDYQSITWGKGIWAFIVVFVWVSIAVFCIFCCVAVVRKGVLPGAFDKKRKITCFQTMHRHKMILIAWCNI